MHLDLVTLIVDDYDEAIAFFVRTLGFELVEDAPSPTNEGPSSSSTSRATAGTSRDGGPLTVGKALGGQRRVVDVALRAGSRA